jgi:ADP-heptose:LPS heptosyltransferase
LGLGDDLIGTGLARGIAPGKRAAFGDGRKILWGPWSEEIFRHNPRIARPGEEQASDLHWLKYYKGHRIYNSAGAGRWIWNYDFRVTPGEVFFAADEFSEIGWPDSFILIEPNVPWHKPVSVNKDWGAANFQALADRLLKDGLDVVQLSYNSYFQGSKRRLNGVRFIETKTFRQALAVLSGAELAVLPEGGLHHGAAALGVPAIVLFGGFIPPSVMGYEGHLNLTGDAKEACGSTTRCQHCAQAMKNISVEQVHELARSCLK